MSPADFSERASTIPNYAVFDHDVQGKGQGIGYNLIDEKAFRFADASEINNLKGAVIVIRTAHGRFMDPQAYLNDRRLNKKSLAKALRKCGGLSIAFIEKQRAKRQEPKSVRPARNNDTILVRRSGAKNILTA